MTELWQASLECAALLVERKLFAESKDEYAVVLFGTEETNNSLEYENVSVVERGTAPADWHLVSITAVHYSRQSKAQHIQRRSASQIFPTR